MTNLTLILQAVIAALRFPEELSKFIKLISESPEEKRQKINAQVDSWMKESSESDRPTWEAP